MRLAVAGQGDEGDVVTARALDVAAADDALGIGEQDDFEQHTRWVGCRTGHIVAKTRIKIGEVNIVVEQTIQRMLKSARQKLPLKVNGKKPRAGVDVFVARHDAPSKYHSVFDLDISFGSRHDAAMKILFLQLR